jgi:FecR protein
MKSAPKILTVTVISFFLTCLSSRSVLGQSVSVSCSPCSGPQGTVVQVTLTGWGGTPVGLVGATDSGGGGTETVSSGCTPVGGTCTASLVMSDGVTTPTTFYIVANEDGLIVTSPQTFTVVPPLLTLSPTCGPGGTVTATGQNFTISDTVNLYFGPTESTLLGTATTDANGNFTQAVTVPNLSGPVSAAAEPQEPYVFGGPTIQQQFTAPSCTQIATVSEISGTVTANGQTLTNGSTVNLDATIVTGPDSQVLITFKDNTQLTLPSNAKIVLDQYVYNPSANPNGSFFFRSLEGAFQYISGLIGSNGSNKQIETGFGTIGIRGTQFIAWPGSVPNSIEIDLLSGIVFLTPSQSVGAQFTGPLTIVMSATGTTTSSLTQDQYNTIYNNLFPSNTDTTPPTVTVTFPAPPAGQAGFFNASQAPVQGTVSATDPSNVTAISCTDSLNNLAEGALSGGGTASATATLSVTGNGVHAITCTATDALGNTGAASGSANTASISIDSTPPSISGSPSPAANSYGWNNTSVTVSFTCSDALSGIASCSAPTTLSAQAANQSVTGTATDKAGNSAQATVSGINIDETPPAVTYTGNAGTYTTNQTIAITCTASDALSGIASTTCANIDGLASSFGVGTHTYSATATDKAGNTGSGSTMFTVTAPVAEFTIAPTPKSETVQRGVIAGFLLTLTPLNGFKGNVTLSCSGGPAGSYCADFPQTVHLNGTAYAVSGILFPKGSAPGTYDITFTGTSGSVTAEATATFTVE